MDLFTPAMVDLRVATRDGQTLHCHLAFLDGEEGVLYVTTKDGKGRELQTRDVVGVWARRWRWSRPLGLAAGVLVVGAGVGRYLTRDGDYPNDGLIGGLLLAAFAAPLVVWLLQDLPPMKRWESLYEEPDA